MIHKLLVVMAATALVSVVCFFALGMIGGFPPGGPFQDGWRDWRGEAWDAGSPQTTRDLPYSGGYRLSVGYPAEITVPQGMQPRFTVTGPRDLLARLSVDDGRLRGPRGPSWNWGRGPTPYGRLRIDIVTPDTREFHLSGSQKLTLRNFDQDRLALHISGSAEVQGQGKA